MDTRDSHGSRGFTLIELLIVVAIIGILAALASGYLLRAKAAANEASAISTLRAVVNGQSTYSSTCGQGYYSTLLSNLVNRHYLNPDADLSPKSGYTFALGPGTGAAGPTDCDGVPTRNAYYMAATPLSTFNGRRGFATNAAGSIWQDRSGTPPPEPFGAAGTQPLTTQ